MALEPTPVENRGRGAAGWYLWPVELGGDPEGRVLAAGAVSEETLTGYLCMRLNVASGLYADAIQIFLHGLTDPITGAPIYGKQSFDTQFWILSDFAALHLHIEMATSGYNPALPYDGRGL